MAPYGLNSCLVNTGCIVCLASWGATNRPSIHPSIHTYIHTNIHTYIPPPSCTSPTPSFFSPPISQIPQTFTALQHPSLCPGRWWEEGGGSFINNANLLLVQKHYSEGNEKGEQNPPIPNEQQWNSLA